MAPARPQLPPFRQNQAFCSFSCVYNSHVGLLLSFTLWESRNAQDSTSFLSKQEVTPKKSPLTSARKGCSAPRLAISAATPASTVHPAELQTRPAGRHSCCSSTACLGDTLACTRHGHPSSLQPVEDQRPFPGPSLPSFARCEAEQCERT